MIVRFSDIVPSQRFCEIPGCEKVHFLQYALVYMLLGLVTQITQSKTSIFTGLDGLTFINQAGEVWLQTGEPEYIAMH